MRKKELLKKLGELVDSINDLHRQLAALRQENDELKAQIKVLKTREQTIEDNKTAETVSEEKNDTGFTVSNFSVEENTETEPSEVKEEKADEKTVIAEEEPDVTATEKTDVRLSDIMEYGAVAIGKIVQETVRYTTTITNSQAENKKELLGLIMGKGEVAKADIFAVAEGDSEYTTKCELIDSIVNDTVDYFKSVVGQI